MLIFHKLQDKAQMWGTLQALSLSLSLQPTGMIYIYIPVGWLTCFQSHVKHASLRVT